jgi:hypothetical protein
LAFRFPHRDDPSGVISQCVRDDDDPAGQAANRNVPRLTVGLTRIFERQRAPGKDLRGIREIQAVLLLVRLVLLLIPFEPHRIYRS